MNPELRRLFWLELTPARMAAAAVALGLFLLTLSDQKGWGVAVIGATHFVILIAVAFWGARKAADALAVELRERTWDQQRLSGLGPAALTLGKVFGAPALAWWVIGLCLLAQALALTLQPPPWRTEINPAFGYDIGWPALAAQASGAFMVFAAAFFAAAAALSGQERPRAFDATLFQLAGVGAAMTLVILVSAQIETGVLTVNFSTPRAEPHLVRWWGVTMEASVALTLTCLSFGLWAVYGGVHQLRRAFAEPTTAAPWIAFLAFLVLFLQGWGARSAAPPTVLALAAAAYAAALLEPHRSLDYRFWLARLAGGNSRALIEGPAWLYAWIVLTVVALADPFSEFDALRRTAGQGGLISDLTRSHSILAAGVLFALRDIGLCVWAGLRAPDGRGLWTATLLLGLLWIVAPRAVALTAPDLIVLFAPMATAASPLIAGAEAIGVWALVGALFLRPRRRAAV